MHHHAHMHIDLDSFFVSVECLNNPQLLGKPVIVGGSSTRGVVAACSYEARKYGLHSAMPIATAKKLCPRGIYLSGDMHAYSEKSQQVTQIIMENAPLVEKASIDEFYLDLTGMDKFFGLQKWAWELREKIIKETRLPLSAGLSINKTVCKIATGEAKPNGKLYIPEAEVHPFLNPLPIQKMPMIGDVTARYLKDLGIHTIGQLAAFPVDTLTAVLGKNGYSLWQRANGIDHSPIVPYREAKSLSTEQTFHADTTDMKFLHTTLTAMVEEVSYKLRAENYMTSCVAVKIRYSNFDTKTQQITIPYTSREDVLLQTIYDLFEKCFDKRLLIRLVGIRFSKLVNANYQLTLFDQAEKKVNLMFAMDKIRSKFGLNKISRVDGIFSLGGKRKKQDNFFNPKGEK